jgi:hypothetical protein
LTLSADQVSSWRSAAIIIREAQVGKVDAIYLLLPATGLYGRLHYAWMALILLCRAPCPVFLSYAGAL